MTGRAPRPTVVLVRRANRGRTGDGRRSGTERIETVIIGGGQAGLPTGYQLKRGGRAVRDPRRRRAHRRRLADPVGIPPAVHAGPVRRLPGLRVPGPELGPIPTKDEMADYLEAYGRAIRPPVRSASGVDELSREGDRFMVASASAGSGGRPSLWRGCISGPEGPPIRLELDPGIAPLPSRGYLNPGVAEGAVLVVGVGDAGAEISMSVEEQAHDARGEGVRADPDPPRKPGLHDWESASSGSWVITC